MRLSKHRTGIVRPLCQRCKSRYAVRDEIDEKIKRTWGGALVRDLCGECRSEILGVSQPSPPSAPRSEL